MNCWRQYHREIPFWSHHLGLRALHIASMAYLLDPLVRGCWPGSSSVRLLLSPLLCESLSSDHSRGMGDGLAAPPVEESIFICSLRFFCKDLSLHLFVYSSFICIFSHLFICPQTYFILWITIQTTRLCCCWSGSSFGGVALSGSSCPFHMSPTFPFWSTLPYSWEDEMLQAQLIYSVTALESDRSPRSPGSFSKRMMFRHQNLDLGTRC